MRLNLKKIFIVCGVLICIFMFTWYSQEASPQPRKIFNEVEMENKLNLLEKRLHSQIKLSEKVLSKIKKKTNSVNDKEYQELQSRQENEESSSPVLPVLVIACDRVTVKRCLDNLVKFRPDKNTFPIIVSQDCGHNATYNVIKSFVDADPTISVIRQPDLSEIVLPRAKVKFRGYYKIARHFKFALNHVFRHLGHEAVIIVEVIRQPDLSEIILPRAKVKFRGYYKIARHFKFALNHVFRHLGHEAVIIVEDDLDISPDFFEYFLGTYPLLHKDPSLWCISAWNDNGKKEVIDQSHPELLHRTDFFPGLGWLLRAETWLKLDPKWPSAFFDDWLRNPDNVENKACIRPEISRTYSFGKIGVSKGLFFDMHLRNIQLNQQFVEFTKLDLSYLLKDNYDEKLENIISSIPEMSANEVVLSPAGVGSNLVRVKYSNAVTYRKNAKKLGLMDDFRSGVPRTAYRGIVTCYVHGRRVYLTPDYPWEKYDPSWG